MNDSPHIYVHYCTDQLKRAVSNAVRKHPLAFKGSLQALSIALEKEEQPIVLLEIYENLMDEYGSISESELQQKLGYDKKIKVDGKQYGIRILAPDLSARERMGLIAHEMKEDFPELIKYDSARMQYSVNYDGFVPVLQEALKAQQEQFNGKVMDTKRMSLTE